jgi:hypothetical protein
MPPPENVNPNESGHAEDPYFRWGGRVWRKGDLAKFKAWLKAHGVSYKTWAKRHPNAAAILTGGQAGGGGGTGDTPPGTDPDAPSDGEIDVSEMFPGLPADVAAQIAKIFKSGGSVTQAVAYIRGTTWHAEQFPGFREAFKLGMIGSEADYRAYHNQANQYYRQFYGRDADKAEIAEWLKSGVGIGGIGQRLSGESIAKTQGGDWNYLLGAFGDGRLDQAQMTTLGQQYAGLDSALGQNLQKKVEEALKKSARLFEGVLASPSLSLGGAGLSAPSLNPKQKPDVGA